MQLFLFCWWVVVTAYCVVLCAVWTQSLNFLCRDSSSCMLAMPSCPSPALAVVVTTLLLQLQLRYTVFFLLLHYLPSYCFVLSVVRSPRLLMTCAVSFFATTISLLFMSNYYVAAASYALLLWKLVRIKIMPLINGSEWELREVWRRSRKFQPPHHDTSVVKVCSVWSFFVLFFCFFYYYYI